MGKKKDKKGRSKQQQGKGTKGQTYAPLRTRRTMGLPTDPWWEEAFKLGVERAAAEAALNSIEVARKEGIVGPKVYERLKEVYTEKLSMIEYKQSKWHQEFPTFSEPAIRRDMMNELSEAVAQPNATESKVPAGEAAEQSAGSRRSTTIRPTATPSTPGAKKEFSLPGGASDIRRSMLSELKGVLSSTKPSLARTPTGSTGRKSAAPERRLTPVPEAARSPDVSPLREQTIKVPSSQSAGVPTRLMELNREFLAELKKLRKTGSPTE